MGNWHYLDWNERLQTVFIWIGIIIFGIIAGFISWEMDKAYTNYLIDKRIEENK
jgi:hypothetical protein